MAAGSLGTLTLDLISNVGGFITPLEKAERETLKAMGRMGSEVDAFGNRVDETYKKIGLSTKQLDNAFDRIAEDLRRQTALYNDSSRAAVLKYDLEKGSLRALSDSQKQYLAGLTKELAILDQAAGGAQGSFRNFRGVAQSAGYQIQDVAVQLQAGTNAFQVFSQQGSQFASAFGPTGAVVGAVLAVAGIVGGILFKSFMDTQKAVKDLQENVKDLTKVYGELNEVQKAVVNKGTAQVVEDLTKKYDEADTALQKQKKSYDELVKSQTIDLTWKNAGIAALTTLAFATDALTTVTGALGLGQTNLTESAYGLFSVEKDQADARKELTASTVAHIKALRDLQEAQDTTGATKVIREMTEEISLMGLRGKALYEATAALKGYDEANTKAFVAVMLLKDATKDQEDVKKRIKDLNDETTALELKNAEIHKNVAAMDELAKKLAESKNTRADGTKISTPEDQAAIAAAELRNTKLKEKNDLDTKSVALYEQQDKAAKDRIKTLEREVALFGISSKAQQLEYDIKSGLIKVNGGLESQQAKRMLQLTKELELMERKTALDKAQETAAFSGYDNIEGHLESTKMQYELDNGILKVNESLTKEYYDQLIALQKVAEVKANNKKTDDFIKSQQQQLDKAKLVTGEEKLRYDILNKIQFVEGGITSERAKQMLSNQRALDIQSKQLELTKAIKDGIVDALMEGAAQGKDIFQNLADTAKGIFQSLVLKPSLDILTDDLAKSLSSVLGSVGTKDSTGQMVGASGALGAIGPYGAAAIAVVGGLQSSWNKSMDERTRKFTAEYRQGVQSTNTILGESGKKSESISHLTQMLAETAYDTLGVNNAMYRALLSIESGIGKLAGGVARSFNASTLTSGIKTGTTTNNNIGTGLALGVANPLIGATLVVGKLIGGEVGGFIDGIVNSVSKAIYSKKTSVIDTGIGFVGQSLADILATGTIEAFQYADIQTKKKFIGFTTSNKVKTKKEDLDDQMKDQFADVFASAADALRIAAPAFGKDFNDYINQLVIDPQKLSLKGLEGDALTKEIENFFSSTLDNWAGVLVGGTDILKEFQQVGEGAFETIVRLASQLNTFNEYADLLELNFTATGVAAIEASQAIIDAAGGFDKLTSSLSSYYSNFYTESQRADKEMEALTKRFKELGYDTVPTTREEFKALVDAIDLNTDAGAELFAGLIGLSDSFASLVKWTDEATQSTEELIKTLKDAASIAFDNLSRSIEAEKSRIQGIVDNAGEAKSALDAALGREKDTVTAAHNERLKQLEDQAKAEQQIAQQMADADYESRKAMAKAQQEATKDQINELEKSVSGLGKLFDDLNSTIFDMALVTDDVTRSRRRAAEFEIETAITNAKAGRGVPTDGRINDALSILRNNPTQLYSSLEEMAYATAVTQNKLKDLADLTGTQKTTEEKTIEILTAQLTAQELAYDGIEKLTVAISKEAEDRIALENEQFDAQIKNLDSIAEDARKQYDALTGVDTSLIDLATAQDNFQKALLAADFTNAKAQLESLTNIETNAKSQLNALLGIETATLSVEAALREFMSGLSLATKAQNGDAVSQANPTAIAAYNALLEETKAMREESYNLNQATLKETRDTTDILRQMQEESVTV